MKTKSLTELRLPSGEIGLVPYEVWDIATAPVAMRSGVTLPTSVGEEAEVGPRIPRQGWWKGCGIPSKYLGEVNLPRSGHAYCARRRAVVVVRTDDTIYTGTTTSPGGTVKVWGPAGSRIVGVMPYIIWHSVMGGLNNVDVLGNVDYTFRWCPKRDRRWVARRLRKAVLKWAWVLGHTSLETGARDAMLTAMKRSFRQIMEDTAN